METLRRVRRLLESALEEGLGELLSFISCPPVHWRKVRTTSAIELAFHEVRRRARAMSCFQDKESVDLIVYGVISHLNQAWKERPIPYFAHHT